MNKSKPNSSVDQTITKLIDIKKHLYKLACLKRLNNQLREFCPKK